MKVICLVLALMVAATAAHAEDWAAQVSQYRRAHGLAAVKSDAQLTQIALRQARAMAATGVLDHSVAGAFATRIAGANVNRAAENIAVGTKTWADTFRIWKSSSGHNANLLLRSATSVGIAVAYGGPPRKMPYWALVIAEKEAVPRMRRAR